MSDLDTMLVASATRVIVQSQFGSTSMLQRRFNLRFRTAQQLLDHLTDRGVLGPRRGSLAREVFYWPTQVESAIARATAPAEHPAS